MRHQALRRTQAEDRYRVFARTCPSHTPGQRVPSPDRNPIRQRGEALRQPVEFLDRPPTSRLAVGPPDGRPFPGQARPGGRDGGPESLNRPAWSRFPTFRVFSRDAYRPHHGSRRSSRTGDRSPDSVATCQGDRHGRPALAPCRPAGPPPSLPVTARASLARPSAPSSARHRQTVTWYAGHHRAPVIGTAAVTVLVAGRAAGTLAGSATCLLGNDRGGDTALGALIHAAG